MERKIKDFLAERRGEDLMRGLKSVSHMPKGRIHAGGREYINFSSNDYLGLSSHPALAEAAGKALSPVLGAASSRLMTGSTTLHDELERRMAAFKGKEASLVFNSGYQANVGIISALCGKNDCVFSDRLNHASIIDGIRLSGAALIRFRHNDAAHLEELLIKERGKYKDALVITETVFSMDGDIAPLGPVASLSKEHDALLMVDEAHATGIFGERGSGLVEKMRLSSDVDVIMGTFSKALGAFGAYAAMSKDIREYLINTCRGFIYSTALPPTIIAADLAALDILESEPWRREKLLSNAGYLRESLREKGFDVRGESQIIPVITGDNKRTVLASEKLKSRGYWVTPVRPPTVPKGQARLRLSLTCDHDRGTIDRFIKDFSADG